MKPPSVAPAIIAPLPVPSSLALALFLGLLHGPGPLTTARAAEVPVPKLRALLVAGGCCHDYASQHKVLFEGIQARANVRVDVVWTDDRSTRPPLPLYDRDNWAEGYDVVIHDECAADTKDIEVARRILEAHKTIPAVHLHCAMHSFRNGTDLWFTHLGLQSSSHGPQRPINVKFTDPQHPIAATLKDWTTINEELYNNVKLLDAHPLATGIQEVSGRTVSYVVAWTNEKQGARSFSTSLGHNTETVADPRYLDLVTRGLLWACGKLDNDHLKAYTGPNTVTFVKAADKKAEAAPRPAPKAQAAPKDATLAKVTASSTQNNNYTWMAIDGNKETRWCADGAGKPQWLQLEFDKPQELTGASIVWERDSDTYGYRLEGSMDGQSWTLLHDAADNRAPGPTAATFPAATLRFLRVTGLRTRGGWISLWELTVHGKGIASLYPKFDDAAAKEANAANDPWKESGNAPPRIVPLTPEEEAAILKDVTVPPEFDVRLFAPSTAANYPVYVAAAPHGDLYVSSDGNGSLGRQPHRGRVLRLRDLDGDGRADEVTEFIADIDSPRGLVWDHDRLLVLHPPHLSVYYDGDGDGVAEASSLLVSGIAFGFDKRPADHTTNGLELGADGWIYIAGGDFGFLDAVGTDGRRLLHRGGGVIRVRPDGTGLELFATGTRNILGTPMSPLLDLFARDNTNDGGGWDIRFHYFSGLEDHGYPRLYMNFPDEHIRPLADYGGGSGCGSVYIHEPGFPEAWGAAPFTCDWGRAALFRHSVRRQGAGFVETEPPQPFIKMTRPTDADVDGMSRVYQASWKGPATFSWAGPDQGYIVRVSPKGFQPEPMPEFDKLADLELVALLESPSQVRALAAQRTLLRRTETKSTTAALLFLAGNASKELRARVAALYAVTQRGVDSRWSARVIESIAPLTQDPALLPFVLRALGDMGLDRLTQGQPGPAPAALLIAGLRSEDARARVEAMVAAARQRTTDCAPDMAAILGDEDPVLAHTAFQALAILGASDACFAVLDTAGSGDRQRLGAAHALMRMHRADVVDGLIKRLESNAQLASRDVLLSALCRLAHREAEWTGDSWGTRPDTRGPYYQLETWEATDRILAALRTALATASPKDAAWLVKEMSRNRIRSNDALERIVDLAMKDESLVAATVAQLAASEDIPDRATPLLIRVARDPATPGATLAEAVQCLARVEDPGALDASLAALAVLDKNDDAGRARQTARRAFLDNRRLDNQHAALERIAAENPQSGEARWAHAALIELASGKDAGPEARAHAVKAIDLAWQDPVRRVVLMQMAAELRNHYLDARITAALNDFDTDGSSAAKTAARRLRIPTPGEDTSPKVDTMATEQALARVVELKGDPALGEAVFLRAACATCHTVSQDQPQKGPYLGNIANTYRRKDLAEAILDPNKTIAQGFATHVLTLKDETELTGFITKEAGDEVTLRDIASQEHTVRKDQIATRGTRPDSIMPPGLMSAFSVNELASLLDYLETLPGKN